jgi:hypothetical protein
MPDEAERNLDLTLTKPLTVPHNDRGNLSKSSKGISLYFPTYTCYACPTGDVWRQHG